MKRNWLLGLVMGFLSLGVVAPEAQAQKDVLRPCADSKECVEFTVRYYLNEPKGGPSGYSGSKRIQLMRGDPTKGSNTLSAAAPGCELEKNSCSVTSGDKVNVIDLSGLRLLQGRRNPTCYLVCNGGWCWEMCF